MARKDEIFRDFLNHKLIKEKYELKPTLLPQKVSDGIKSSIPVVKTIALIIEKLETTTTSTDASLRNLIIQNLNEMP